MFKMVKFPELLSDEEIKKYLDSMAGDLSPVTVCECGEIQYAHRLGCRCGGKIQWRYMDNGGTVLECDVDFSPWPQQL
jgi:hypothetical protein